MVTNENLDDYQQTGKTRLPLFVRPIELLERKTGIFKFVDRYAQPLNNFIDNHSGLISRIGEIGGTGVVGYSLAKFIYAQTPGERGSALFYLVPSAFITICAATLDLIRGMEQNLTANTLKP